MVSSKSQAVAARHKLHWLYTFKLCQQFSLKNVLNAQIWFGSLCFSASEFEQANQKLLQKISFSVTSVQSCTITGALDIWKAKKAFQGETGGLRMLTKFDFYLISNFNCWVSVVWKDRYPAGSHSVRCFVLFLFVFILRQNNLFWHLQQCSL